MRHVVIVVLVGAVIALVGMSGRPTRAADAPAAMTKVRIGTYDSRAIALAWGRSSDFQKDIQEQMAKHKTAKDAGDEKVATEIEGQMKMLQDKMHWQVFSDWNIDNILKVVRPNYPEIARKARVTAIVPRVEFNDGTIEAVDVTDLMAEQFAPDEKTKAMMKDIASKPALTFEKMREVKTED
jgi:hypothetical protein